MSSTARSKRLRARLAEAQNQRCAYCFRRFDEHGKRSTATIDHIQPRCTGGRKTYENSVAACLNCNGKRGNQNAVKFSKERHRQRQLKMLNPTPRWQPPPHENAPAQ